MLLSLVERVYRLLHDRLFLRLPEARAVRLGQILLRAIPVPFLRIVDVDDPRLAVTLAGVRLPSPVILSSMYYDPRILGRAMVLGFGAVTTKSITVSARPGHPEPNLVRLSTPEGRGFVNCNGFQNPGLPAFRTALRSLPRVRPLIVSVAGESPDEYVRLVEGLEAYADLVEINISSPNTRLVYELSAVPERVRALLGAVRRATTKPLIVKLSPDFADQNHDAILPAVLETGIDAVNFGNTRRVAEPRLSQGAGGVSGPALFPGVLAEIRALRQIVGPKLGLIATGGIDSAEKALTALEAGADAVAYFSAFVTGGPTLARRIGDALVETLERRRLQRVADLHAWATERPAV
jgi:dihydroorotate dehydrogenase